MIDHADRMRDWAHMIHAIERARPIHPPGERTGYHGLTFGYLVGEILQRVTGRSFSRLVREELVEPLALDGMYIGAPRDAFERAAQLLWPKRPSIGLLALEGTLQGDVVMRGAGALQWLLGLVGVQFDLQSVLDALAPRGINAFDFGSEETLRASIPAANGLFTARSLGRLYAALAGGGEIDGVRLLSQRTLTRATRPQDRPHSRVVIPFDMRWRLGYHGVATTRGVPRRAFGHFGFGGSGAWADPRRDLAVALIVNAGLGTPFGDLRILRIGGAALGCANARPPLRRRSEAAHPALAPARQRA
jgi:CubicO group peptidase (beta-lactamase class C family)